MGTGYLPVAPFAATFSYTVGGVTVKSAVRETVWLIQKIGGLNCQLVLAGRQSLGRDHLLQRDLLAILLEVLAGS